MYQAAVVGGGAVLTLPMIRAIMSRMTSPDKQGTANHMRSNIQ